MQTFQWGQTVLWPLGSSWHNTQPLVCFQKTCFLSRRLQALDYTHDELTVYTLQHARQTLWVFVSSSEGVLHCWVTAAASATFHCWQTKSRTCCGWCRNTTTLPVSRFHVEACMQIMFSDRVRLTAFCSRNSSTLLQNRFEVFVLYESFLFMSHTTSTSLHSSDSFCYRLKMIYSKQRYSKSSTKLVDQLRHHCVSACEC